MKGIANKEESDVTALSQTLLTMTSKKRKLFFSLMGSAIISTMLIAFAPLNADRNFYSDLTIITTSGSAFAISMQVVYRQKLKGVFPRIYASLGLSLGLWFAAEIIWTYYELAAGIEIPFPSIADAFWLAGYVPFFYFLYGIMKHFLSTPRSSSMYISLFIGSSVGLLLVANILFSIYQSADLETSDGVFSYLVSSAYPISDIFLIMPATAAFIQLRKGKLTFTPWAYFLVATVVFIIADIGFADFTQIGGLEDSLWIWNPLYNLGYLAIACSLFWHKEFFTIDEKKLTRAWQEKNR